MLFPLVGLLGIGSVGLAVYARGAVHRTVAHYREVPARAGLSGREVAEYVLRASGVEGVEIERAKGVLSDHYDPRRKILRLSDDIYDGRHLTAFGIAAHEAGHAVQHAYKYPWLGLRSFTAPVAMLGSTVGLPVALLGLGLRSPLLIFLGLGLFAVVVLFQLITLPVELDASRRAIKLLRGSGLMETEEEETGVRSVLSSAALTYLASAVAGIASLFHMAWRLLVRRV
jgi:uncharacterized protein